MNITPTLITLDPKLLTTNQNVRKDLVLGKEFLASIKLHGVRSPIEAFPDPLLDGHYQVHTGHRRAAAALKAELSEVLVLVITAREAADRVTEQLVENLHRQELTPQDLAAGYHDLSLFGQSAMTIAKNTSSKLALVGDALRVAKAPTATKALEQYQLTIDDALVFAEFEDDPDALIELNRAAKNEPSRIPHTAQVLRNERTEKAERSRVTAEITAAAITFLAARPSYEDRAARPIDKIYTDKIYGTELTAEVAIAEACDDLRAYVKQDYAQGGGYTYEIGYAVANWPAHGWISFESTNAASGPLSDDEKDARRASRESNKLWVAATQVRTHWVKELLQRRSLPNEAPALAALYFATFPGDYGSRVRALAHELLGEPETVVKLSWGGERAENAMPALVQSSPAQAVHVLVAIAVAGIEQGLDDKKGWSSDDPKLPLYLMQLVAWGYKPAQIEQSVIDNAATKGN